MTREEFEWLENRWVVARYRVQRPQFLSRSRVWDTIGNAAWFVDQAESNAALCPPGTTGISVQIDAAPKASVA